MDEVQTGPVSNQTQAELELRLSREVDLRVKEAVLRLVDSTDDAFAFQLVIGVLRRLGPGVLSNETAFQDAVKNVIKNSL